MSEQFTEYVVEVPGKGYINCWTAFGDSVTDTPPSSGTWGADLSYKRALEAYDRARGQYEQMGCADVAETIRIVSRIVTVERTDWCAKVPTTTV